MTEPQPGALHHAWPAELAIGIDVGGTKIAAGLVDRSGQMWLRRTVPTDAQQGGEAVLEKTLELAGELVVAAGQARIVGAGVSVCELVDRQGRVTSGYTVAWQAVPVRERIAERVAPCVVESDVRAHATAEAAFGAGCGLESFIFVSVGTGISSCLVLDGRPYAGVHGNALVLSTMPLVVFDADERKVEFALEAFASGAGMVTRYRRYRPEAARVETIVADAAQGSAQATAILRSGGEALGSALAWLVNVLDPASVIVGGGLGLAGGLYWQCAVDVARTHIFAETSRDTPIVPAACGVDAGIVGAAACAFASDPY